MRFLHCKKPRWNCRSREGCGIATAGSVTRALITLRYIDLES